MSHAHAIVDSASAMKALVRRAWDWAQRATVRREGGARRGAHLPIQLVGEVADAEFGKQRQSDSTKLARGEADERVSGSAPLRVRAVARSSQYRASSGHDVDEVQRIFRLVHLAVSASELKGFGGFHRGDDVEGVPDLEVAFKHAARHHLARVVLRIMFEHRAPGGEKSRAGQTHVSRSEDRWRVVERSHQKHLRELAVRVRAVVFRHLPTRADVRDVTAAGDVERTAAIRKRSVTRATTLVPSKTGWRGEGTVARLERGRAAAASPRCPPGTSLPSLPLGRVPPARSACPSSLRWRSSRARAWASWMYEGC
jgi:hypothetical protein